MAAVSSPVSPMLQDNQLTNEIFSILESKFLFGKPSFNLNLNPTSAAGKVRILSIDAGDAILAATTLLHLQSILRAKSGNPHAHIADFFDVVAGSGAGGLLAGLLFTRGKDGAPIFTADQSLEFLLDHHRTLSRPSAAGVFRQSSKAGKLLKKVFGEATLKDTMKAVLIPCYDLTTGAPVLFSRADALEMDNCDFQMASLCEATLADRAVHLKSTDGVTKILAVGGRVGMSNPTAGAITHVLNNKQEFPLCDGLRDLLVVSLGNGSPSEIDSATALANLAADGTADMVDQAVAMAFGEWRSNYVRIQGNGRCGIAKNNNKEKRKISMARKMEEILREKNVESILFKGKKMVEFTNLEKLEMLGVEIIKEQERRENAILPTVVLKSSSSSSNSNGSPRTSSATTLSTLSD